jgi:hypothetical protein
MIAAQLRCDPSEAMDRLVIRSAALEQDVETTALDVLDGEIRFDSCGQGPAI